MTVTAMVDAFRAKTRLLELLNNASFPSFGDSDSCIDEIPFT